MFKMLILNRVMICNNKNNVKIQSQRIDEESSNDILILFRMSINCLIKFILDTIDMTK